MDTAVEAHQLERHLVLEGLGGWHFRKHNCVQLSWYVSFLSSSAVDQNWFVKCEFFLPIYFMLDIAQSLFCRPCLAGWQRAPYKRGRVDILPMTGAACRKHCKRSESAL